MAALLAALLTGTAQAQLDGARTYLPLPINTNIVTGMHIDGTANASFSVLNRLQGDIDIESDIYLLGYLRSHSVFGRTAHWQALMPAGSIQTNSPLPLSSNSTYADGLGDLTLGGMINLIGAPVLPVREAVRHEVDLLVNVGFDITLPTGSYDENEALNLGSNQTSLRLSAPIIKSLGDWVPTRRTTFEITPSVRIFGDNDESMGNSISQDPLYSVEMHLTRDMTESAYVSLDYTWLDGAEETITDIVTGLPAGSTTGLNARLVGATLGFEINDNFVLKVSHMQSVGGDSVPVELQGSLTKVQFVWAWHDVLQPRRRFNRE
jgi:hypothetical protein